ncbi:MAG: hypothetical protein ABI671_14390 [Burkholderiales bacterium]
MPPATRLWRLAVGIFAGALASFFPRLVTVLSGNPTDNIAVFSPTYLAVGATVALVVGITITIVDDDPHRPMRDFFMTALGVPALLMGALSTNATAHNTALDQLRIKTMSDQLANASKIEVRTEPQAPGARMNVGAISLLDLVIPAAHAQGASLSPPRPSPFGITSIERQYTTVLKEAGSADDLHALQKTLGQQGFQTQVVSSTPGRVLLVPAGPAKPYSEALLSAVRAKELGASPYLVPAR